jgi:hypothetical protein
VSSICHHGRFYCTPAFCSHTFLPVSIPLLEELLKVFFCDLLSAATMPFPLLLLTGTCIPSKGLSFSGRGSDRQGLHLKSGEVVEAQWYHSWSDTPVPKETSKLVHVMVEQPVSRFPKMTAFMMESFLQATKNVFVHDITVTLFWN